MEKRMQRLVMAGLILALAGCGGEEPVANIVATPTPTPTPAPSLGGINLNKPIRARGTSPYWDLYLAPGTITYAASAKPGAAIDLYPASLKRDGDHATLTTQTPEGEPVTITLTEGSCGSGNAAAPLRAEAKIGTRTLAGCAMQTAWAWQKDKPKDHPAR
ncbi:hypothetical protein [Sphingomonas sp. LM7]|uniref:hypothetical protein n=1 Tax=Sphingomonas sp. LM7 TaxID=1938607 RepID=UPI000983DB1E|nr:hypothetical protein [Sphingomonas sp. LM7]AQR72394.1 hypothetical protein BXU08_00770 [Sphingomonas sp. LM7]